MIRTLTLSTMAAFWAASAFAACEGRTTVLDCPIGSKQLTVCIGGGEASYAYGPKGAPELAVTQPLGQVQGTAWAGVGRSIWEEIIFTNGNVTYGVWHSMDRLTEGNPTDGGVLVTKGDRTLADLQCEPGRAAVTIFAISDGFAAAGFCWDRSNFRYARTCAD